VLGDGFARIGEGGVLEDRRAVSFARDGEDTTTPMLGGGLARTREGERQLRNDRRGGSRIGSSGPVELRVARGGEAQEIGIWEARGREFVAWEDPDDEGGADAAGPFYWIEWAFWVRPSAS
jgi:hypothetical protein